MIERARANALVGGYQNVEFHLAMIDKIPLPDVSVDCVISNCVINLAPDKNVVFREIARILKPGGRLAVSDIALKGELPPAVARSLAAYVGCIAGAIDIDAYREGLLAAGFEHVEIVDSEADLNAYAKVQNQAGCCSPSHGCVARPAGSCGVLLLDGEARKSPSGFGNSFVYLRRQCSGRKCEGLCGQAGSRDGEGLLWAKLLLVSRRGFKNHRTKGQATGLFPERDNV